MFNQSATKPSYEKVEWPPFLSLAQFFTAHGYAFFLPGRYPHEELDHPTKGNTNSTKASPSKSTQQSEARNADLLAAISWVKGQSYIDENRIVLCGHSAGAIQALLVSAKTPEIRGTITFSVGAISWKRQSNPAGPAPNRGSRHHHADVTATTAERLQHRTKSRAR